MDNKVLEIIIDGYGYDPDLEIDILKSCFQRLPNKLKMYFIKNIHDMAITKNIELSPEIVFILLFNRNPLNIYFEKKYGMLSELGEVNLINIRGLLNFLKKENNDFITQVKKLIENISREKKYAVWAASTPTIDSFREKYPSISTKTSGIEVGYEDLRPEVQGNSDTGHQQLGNMTVAPQIPLEVSMDIESGKFFDNHILNQCIKEAIDNNVNLNITVMISGEFGNDGRVHSCWDHLENFLKLVFTKYQFNPSNLRIQAILDGRDAPLKSSIEKVGKKYGFLYKLKDLLSKYNADDSIAWIIGRGIAMDRDYEEERTKKDYELLVKGKGILASDFYDAVKKISEFHKKQFFDPFINPIIIKDKNGSIRMIEQNDVLVNLNFRADRQRARIASLLGAKQFLQNESSKKGKKWQLDWIQDNLQIKIYCLTEYHPDFEKYGAKIAYPIKSHKQNCLHLFSKYFKQKEIPFKYLLIAESNKALHVGYFIRGRREKIEIEESERRYIIPSFAKEDGIHTDDDYFKTPQMKAYEITGKLLNEMYRGFYKLAIINLSNPDMLGHLIVNHFDANVKALEVIDNVIKIIVEFALKLNYYIIITSDHGNIDEYSSSHSLNNVITTFISPQSNIKLKPNLNERINLFDISWAIAEIFNISEEIKNLIPPIPEWIRKKGLVGKVPIEMID